MSDSTGSTPPSPLKKKGMKPWLIAIIVVVIVVVLVGAVVAGGFLNAKASQSELDKIKSQGKIIMWTEATFEPFESFDPMNLTFSGFDIDLANRITENVSADLGVNISLDINDKAFSTIPAALKTSQCDMSLSGMTITAARNQSVLFSVPYYNDEAGYGLLVKSSSTITSIDDVVNASAKIVVNTGTTSENWVQEKLVNTGKVSASNVISLPTIANCVQEVMSGYASVFIIDKPTVDTYVADPSTGGQLKDAGTIQAIEPYGVAMPLGATDLKVIVDRVITNMVADGEMHALMVKWGLSS